LSENTLLAEPARGWIDWAGVASRATAIVDRFGVKTAGVNSEARRLSGGNLQKFLLGRELAARPVALIAAQPTWGVDAGAAALIHREIVALADGGAAVVLVSQDLDELFAVAHDIAVIAGGRLSPPQPVEAVTVEQIGLLMGGDPSATPPATSKAAHHA
jgi:simple sugar transport system ATP-binding protein